MPGSLQSLTLKGLQVLTLRLGQQRQGTFGPGLGVNPVASGDKGFGLETRGTEPGLLASQGKESPHGKRT